ncbi:hypothetical protein EV1_010719 [Malus domestica]
MFQAFFEAGIQGGGSTGPPFRVDTIINGQVDDNQLNFIHLYQGHGGIKEQSEKGYNLFVMHPTIWKASTANMLYIKIRREYLLLINYVNGILLMSFLQCRMRFDKVMNRRFRLATIKGDTGPYVLQFIKFSMNNYDEKLYALQAL